MLTKKKLIFVINVQKLITSNIRHLQVKKVLILLYITKLEFASKPSERPMHVELTSSQKLSYQARTVSSYSSQ